jgi:hypothetical protein
MKNSTLLFKRELNPNTSVLVTFSHYSKDYQIRLNHADGIRYQSASTLENAQTTCKNYLDIAQSLIKE